MKYFVDEKRSRDPLNSPVGVSNTWVCADDQKQKAREGKRAQQATSLLILSDHASPHAARLISTSAVRMHLPIYLSKSKAVGSIFYFVRQAEPFYI
jgi:hypothetical protein